MIIYNNNLKKIREKKGVSLRKLSLLVNIHYSQILNLETGFKKFTPTILSKLANALDVKESDIVDNKDYISEEKADKNNLRKIRKQKQLSQYELALLINSSSSIIARLENGKKQFTAHQLTIIAKALKVKESEIVDNPEEIKNKNSNPSLIKRLREEKGFSQIDLANLIGVTDTAISHVEAGRRTLSYEKIQKLAQILEVSESELINDSKNLTKQLNKKLIEETKQKQSSQPTYTSTPLDVIDIMHKYGVSERTAYRYKKNGLPKTKQLNLKKEIYSNLKEKQDKIPLKLFIHELSAGTGISSSKEHKEYSIIDIDREALRKITSCGFNNLVCFYATGKSMQPLIDDGDLLIIDTSQNTITGDSIYALIYNDHMFVKNVQIIPNGFILHSLNKSDGFEPFTITPTEEEQVKVIGKVLGKLFQKF